MRNGTDHHQPESATRARKIAPRLLAAYPTFDPANPTFRDVIRPLHPAPLGPPSPRRDSPALPVKPSGRRLIAAGNRPAVSPPLLGGASRSASCILRPTWRHETGQTWLPPAAGGQRDRGGAPKPPAGVRLPSFFGGCGRASGWPAACLPRSPARGAPGGPPTAS